MVSKITYLHSRAIDAWDAACTTAEQLENPKANDELTIFFIRPIIIKFLISEIRRVGSHSTELASGIEPEDSC